MRERRTKSQLCPSLVGLRCAGTALTLLVKDVKDVNDFWKDHISRPVRLAIVIVGQLHNLPTQTFAKRASTNGMISVLRV